MATAWNPADSSGHQKRNINVICVNEDVVPFTNVQVEQIPPRNMTGVNTKVELVSHGETCRVNDQCTVFHDWNKDQ